MLGASAAAMKLGESSGRLASKRRAGGENGAAGGVAALQQRHRRRKRLVGEELRRKLRRVALACNVKGENGHRERKSAGGIRRNEAAQWRK
jgi:hypothetical protein